MKYGFIVNNTIDTISYNPPRELIPAIPAVLNEDGSVKTPAVEEHWGNLLPGWIQVDDNVFAGYVKQNGQWVAPETPPKGLEEVLAGYKFAFDTFLDRVAQAKQYDNRHTIVGYCTSGVKAWSDEAKEFVTYRDDALQSMFSTLSKVQAGEIEQPSIEEFIQSMPETPWPVEQ